MMYASSYRNNKILVRLHEGHYPITVGQDIEKWGLHFQAHCERAIDILIVRIPKHPCRYLFNVEGKTYLITQTHTLFPLVAVKIHLLQMLATTCCKANPTQLHETQPEHFLSFPLVNK